MVQRFKETGHPVFTSASALSRGILRKLKAKETTHFNADVSNTELLFRIIHSVNQFSICGAVANWCEEFGLWPTAKENSVSKEILKSVNSQEVNSLVGAPRTGPASGNRLRECLAAFAAQGRSWYEL